MAMKKLTKWITGISAASAVLFAYSAVKENRSVRITRYKILSKRLPSAFSGYKILQISDLHQFRLGKNQEELLAIIRKTDCDMIVITGDLFDKGKSGENAYELLRGLQGGAPVFYSLGNHESRIHNLHEYLAKAKDLGAVLLDNEGLRIRKGGQSIVLYGMTDPDFAHAGHKKDRETAGSYLKRIEQYRTFDDYTVVMCHRPDFIDLHEQAGIDLVLCGHAHGGQYRLPYIGALYAPGQGLFPEYTEGALPRGRTVEIISRGLGCSHIPFRINVMPELCVITLEKEESK